MKRSTWLSLAAFFMVALPLVVLADLVPCTGAPGDECQLCRMAELVNNVVSWLVGILTIFVAIVIVINGSRLVTSAGNVSAKEAAKKSITNTLVGFVIVLAAWLLIDLGMKMLLSDAGSQRVGVWNAIECVRQPQSQEVVSVGGIQNAAIFTETCEPDSEGNLTNCDSLVSRCESRSCLASRDDSDPAAHQVQCACGGTPGLNCDRTGPDTFDCTEQELRCRGAEGSPTRDLSDSNQHRVICDLPGSGSSYGGGCGVINDPGNACHPDNLTCFSNSTDASRVCNLESAGGNQGAISGSDLCKGGDSFSFGLWQINILANHRLIPGCDGNFFVKSGRSAQGECLTYDTNSNGVRYCAIRNCEITDRSMYETCKLGALNPANNTSAACELYSDARGWDPWVTSAEECLR